MNLQNIPRLQKNLSHLYIKHFVCRIKERTTRTIIQQHDAMPDSHIFYDALVLLGTPNQNQTKNSVRVVGYEIAQVKYYVATDRHDLTAEQVASIYKLRWTIEKQKPNLVSFFLDHIIFKLKADNLKSGILPFKNLVSDL